MGRSMAFIDTETTGLARTSQVWEVAVVKEGRPLHLMLPIDVAAADPVALDIGGFHERHPQGSRFVPELQSAPLVSEVEASAQVIEMTSGTHLVAANPGFDIAVLITLFESVGASCEWNYHALDIESYAIGWLGSHGIALPQKWSSDALAQLCGVPPMTPQERHTAMGDVTWVMRWWEVMGRGVAYAH